MIVVRELTEADLDAWTAMRRALWPDEDPAALAGESAAFFEKAGTWGLFVATRRAVVQGFAECRLRETAPGCRTTPVGYLEAWYVAPEARRHGIGRLLVEQCEEWARRRGAREMASDTEPRYAASPAAHVALGYRRVGDGLHFTKSLVPQLRAREASG